MKRFFVKDAKVLSHHGKQKNFKFIYYKLITMTDLNTKEREISFEKTSEGGSTPLDYLQQLFSDPNFTERLVATSTKDSGDAMRAFDDRFKKHVQRLLNDLKNQAALEDLGRTGEDLNIVRGELRGEWGKALAAVTEVSIEIAGKTFTKPVAQVEEVLKDRLHGEYEEEYDTLKATYDEDRDQARERLSALSDSIPALSEDTEFSQALDRWGSSPNSEGNRGEDGQGFHAGVVHYFEYRQNSEKAGRFSREAPEDFSLNGFVEYTESVAHYVEASDAELEAFEGVQGFVRLRDEQGQERLILDSDAGFVVGFKKAEEDSIKVITVLPNSNKPKKNTKRFQSAAKAAYQEGNPKNYLNCLNDPKELVAADAETMDLLG